MDSRPQAKIKLLIVGDSGVGKTSVLIRYTQNQFSSEFLSTVGVDFKVKKIQTQTHRVVLALWDTAGQERFRTITKSFYKGSHGVVLAYSITDRKSFNHIESWLTQIKSHCEGEVQVMLLGCKSDLQEQRKVTTKQGQEIASRHGIHFKEVSAKANTGLNTSFDTLTRQILKTTKISEKKGGALNQKGKKSKSRCC